MRVCVYKISFTEHEDYMLYDMMYMTNLKHLTIFKIEYGFERVTRN